MAVGRSAAVCTGLAPRDDPPRAGLTNNGRPSRVMTRSITALAPRSWKISRGSATESGVAIPAAATSALAVGLSNAARQALAIEPT